MGPNGKICFADFEIDTTHRLLKRGGETISVNAKAFDVLAFLAANAGRIVTKNEILDSVWENQFVEEANLKVQISALRKALGEQKDEHRFLVTVPGKGYKFVADVRNGTSSIVVERREVSHLVVEEETEISETATENSYRWFSARPLTTAIVCLALLTVGTTVFLYSRSAGDERNPAVAVAAPEPDLKQLTHQGSVNRVELSPDSKFFAYTVRKRGSYETELRLGQTDGGSDVLLRSVPSLSQYTISFSPDGQWIYYVEIPAVSEYQHQTGALYRMPVLRGVPQKLSDAASVFSVLSPDEKYIAFPRNNNESDSSTLVVAEIGGSNEREIVARPSDQFIEEESLTWSADGQSIAFSAATGATKADSSNRSFEVFVARLADGRVEQLTKSDWNRVDSLDWLKDGSGLVATGRDPHQINTSSLWMVDYPSGSVRRLSRDVNRYAWSSTSGDSRSLVTIESEAETHLWLAQSADPASASQITFSSSGRQDGWYGLDWTPDDRIVFTAWIDQSLTLWTADADGSNATQLTSVGFRDSRPVVSADGKFVVFESNRSVAKELWKIDIDGSNLQQLTADGGNSSPSVTPDGMWVVYRHSVNGKASLWRMPLSGGLAVQISDASVILSSVSPDGKLVACAADVGNGTKLVVYRIDGGEPFKVFDVPATRNFRYSLKWSPDNSAVLYPDEVNGIWQQNLAGGEPSRLKGLPPERTFAFAWSRDGKRFTFGRQHEERDAVLISNFR